jgi:DNA-binding CsgD family transcriptional regulator
MRLSVGAGEFHLIDHVLAERRRGRGAVVVVNGSVGSGKTALLQDLTGRAGGEDGHAFTVRASARERPNALGLIDELTRAMRMAGSAEAAAAVAAPVVPAAGQDRPHLLPVLRWFTRAVHDLAAHRPVLLGIDDVHFADPWSLECLGYLIRRIETAPVLAVLTESSHSERDLATLHAETLHLPYCHRIRLRPLPPETVAERVSERLGDVSPEVAEFCADASGGNAVLLQGLVEDYASHDPSSDPAQKPQPGFWFRHAVLRCLHRCPADMVAVARAAAVLGGSANASLISELAGLDAPSVRACMLNLGAMGLLAGGRFRNEEARLAVLADVPAGELSPMHSRAAELLHETGAPVCAVAEQMLAAHEPMKADWQVSVLRAAAAEAMAAGDVSAAIGYLRHAPGVCTHAVQRAEVIAELADAQWHLDPATAARYLPGLVDDVRSGLLTGPAALAPIRHLRWRGEFDRADELARRLAEQHAAGRAIDWVGADPRSAAGEPEAITLIRWWTNLRRSPGPGGRAAGDTAEGAVAAILAYGGDAHRTDRLCALRSGAAVTPVLCALVLLIESGRPGEALHWADRLLGESLIAGVPIRRATFETIRAAAVLRLGDAAAAVKAARGALDALSPAGWGVPVGLPLALLVRAAVESSDLRTARSCLDHPVPPAMFASLFAVPYLQALGHYHLATGHPETALGHFRSCGDLMAQWRLESPDLVDWRTDAATALIALGRPDPARVLVEEQLTHLGERHHRARGVALRLLAAVAPEAERPALLQQAVRDLHEAADPAELRRARGDLHAAQIQAPMEELTDAERRVAALAAAGASNRQIADRLFITVSTVEQHLTKIYRKLNVRRRSGLPARLLRELHQ